MKPKMTLTGLVMVTVFWIFDSDYDSDFFDYNSDSFNYVLRAYCYKIDSKKAWHWMKK